MAMTETHNLYLRDIKQTPWQLAAIQITGLTSLPVLTSSILLLDKHNFRSAVLTLILANIILWFIRFGIISMSFRGRKSTLDVARDYLGKIGSYCIAFVLLASTLAWFIAQTTLAAKAINFFIPLKENVAINQFVQISVVLGICSTLLCMEGMPVLKWLSVIALPIVLVAFILALITIPIEFATDGKNVISLQGLALVLGTNLGITADLPTFFRHSGSWKNSVKALTIIQIMTLLLGVGALFFGSLIHPWLGIKEGADFENTLLKSSLIVIVFVSVICANVSNVYSASVGWELVAPVLAGRKEYLILGLGLTIIFILIANIFSMDLLLQTTDVCLVNLALVLILSFIIRRFEHHPPDLFEKTTYCIAWVVASLVNILQFLNVIAWESTLLVATTLILGILFCGLLLRKTAKIRWQ